MADPVSQTTPTPTYLAIRNEVREARAALMLEMQQDSPCRMTGVRCAAIPCDCSARAMSFMMMAREGLP